MNPLEELHIRIDKESWDVKQEDLFNKAFQEVSSRLDLEGSADLLHKSEIERQVFAFTKNPEKGLSFKLAGTNTLADGKEIPFEWPDINTWTNVDYEYIRIRFLSCKN